MNLLWVLRKQGEFMKKTGIVFDIQRFSLHDGPGIRTTVFLKGCPLRCKWCHNPESWLLEPQLMFREDKCTNCLRCVGSCPNQVHKSRQGRHAVDFPSCTAKGDCAAQCLNGALKLSGKEVEVDEVLEEVWADRSYYHNSGGGLTISGGEPMMQFAFTRKLLEQSKKRFDIKLISDEEHKKYTGVSNAVILDNLHFLYEKGADILLRCPIIPGINDTQEQIEEIGELSRNYPDLRGVEILPYHDMGKGKWGQTGKDYTLGDLKNLDEDPKMFCLSVFRLQAVKRQLYKSIIMCALGTAKGRYYKWNFQRYQISSC